MKKVVNTLLIVVIMALVSNVSAVFSQESNKSKSKTYRQAITTDPIDLLNTDRFNIKYEQVLGKKNSFTIDLMYNYGYTDVLGISIGGGYRWYFHTLFPELKTKGIEGLAVGGFANINYLRFTHKDETGNSYSNNDVAFDIGVEATYKFVLFEALAIEPALRLGWGFSGAGYYSTGFGLWPGVSIGYAW